MKSPNLILGYGCQIELSNICLFINMHIFYLSKSINYTSNLFSKTWWKNNRVQRSMLSRIRTLKKFQSMPNLPCLTRMFSGSAPARVDCTYTVSCHLKPCLLLQATFALKDFVDHAHLCLVSPLLKGRQTKFQKSVFIGCAGEPWHLSHYSLLHFFKACLVCFSPWSPRLRRKSKIVHTEPADNKEFISV